MDWGTVPSYTPQESTVLMVPPKPRSMGGVGTNFYAAWVQGSGLRVEQVYFERLALSILRNTRMRMKLERFPPQKVSVEFRLLII